MSILPFLIQARGNIADAGKRAELLTTYYVLMRYIDDIVDGDIPLPDGYASRTEYVRKRSSAIERSLQPEDHTDSIFLYCEGLAEQLGFRLYEESKDILESLLFDAERIEFAEKEGKPKVYPAAELHRHFYLLDVRGTTGGMLKLFGDCSQKARLLEPAGNAHRIKMNIQDLRSDIRAGLVNISAEDLRYYSISGSDFTVVSSIDERLSRENLATHRLPSSIVSWIYDQSRIGLESIEEQRKILVSNSFRTIGAAVLRFMFMKPTEEYFKRILSRA